MSNSVEVGKLLIHLNHLLVKCETIPYLGKYKRHAMAKINMAAGSGYWKYGDFNNSVKFMSRRFALIHSK